MLFDVCLLFACSLLVHLFFDVAEHLRQRTPVKTTSVHLFVPLFVCVLAYLLCARAFIVLN